MDYDFLVRDFFPMFRGFLALNLVANHSDQTGPCLALPSLKLTANAPIRKPSSREELLVVGSVNPPRALKFEPQKPPQKTDPLEFGAGIFDTQTVHRGSFGLIKSRRTKRRDF